MKQSTKETLLWVFTILGVPAIIILTFLLNGYLDLRVN